MKHHILVTLVLVALLTVVVPFTSYAKPVKFAVLSDIHYAVNGKDSEMKMLATGKKILPGLLQEISARNDIDFVVFTGDLFVDPLDPELKELPQLLNENLKKPFFVVPGNHDRPTQKQKDAGLKTFSLDDFVFAFKGHPYSKGKNAYWSTDFDGYHLIGLDSTMWETWGGTIPPDELKWLKSDLKRNRNKFTIIFLHHSIVELYPEYKLDANFFTNNSEELQKLIVNNSQVKLVVSGHYHVPAEVFKNTVHYVSIPSIITYPCKYSVISADTNEIKVENIEVGEKDFVARAKKEMVKENSWRTKFSSDKELQNLYKGFNTYSFEPRD